MLVTLLLSFTVVPRPNILIMFFGILELHLFVTLLLKVPSLHFIMHLLLLLLWAVRLLFWPLFGQVVLLDLFFRAEGAAADLA